MKLVALHLTFFCMAIWFGNDVVASKRKDIDDDMIFASVFDSDEEFLDEMGIGSQHSVLHRILDGETEGYNKASEINRQSVTTPMRNMTCLRAHYSLQDYYIDVFELILDQPLVLTSDRPGEQKIRYKLICKTPGTKIVAQCSKFDFGSEDKGKGATFKGLQLNEKFNKKNSPFSLTSLFNRMTVRMFMKKEPEHMTCTFTAMLGGITQAPEGCSECGLQNPLSPNRIVLGTETSPNKYPWMVGLITFGSKKPFCGGVIICDSWVLTTGLCTTKKDMNIVCLALAEHNWQAIGELKYTRFRGIEKVIVHPDYKEKRLGKNRNFECDIALIKVKHGMKFTFANRVAPACLPSAIHNSYENLRLTATGWGNKKFIGMKASESLQEINMTALAITKCSKKYPKRYNNDIMICAGAQAGGPCKNDEGGPLMYDKDGSVHLAGLISNTFKCGKNGRPTVFTRISHFLPWINSVTDNCKPCNGPSGILPSVSSGGRLLAAAELSKKGPLKPSVAPQPSAAAPAEPSAAAPAEPSAAAPAEPSAAAQV